jgi:hypothetical protein
MYLLTLLAFFFHQIFELSDPAYQLCRRIFVANTSLREEFRALVRHFIHTGWEQLMVKMLGERDNKQTLIVKKIDRPRYPESAFAHMDWQ